MAQFSIVLGSMPAWLLSASIYHLKQMLSPPLANVEQFSAAANNHVYDPTSTGFFFPQKNCLFNNNNNNRLTSLIIKLLI